MKVAIVDDLKKERIKFVDLFSNALKDYESIDCKIIEFECGEDFLNSWQSNTYDVIVLDIFMKDLTGIQVAKKVRETDENVKIVFSTASNEFASESYSVNATYYLHKPFGENEIIQMLSKLNIDDIKLKKTIVLPDKQKLFVRNMIYSECYNHNMLIHNKIGPDIKTRITQTEFCSLLQDESYMITCAKGIIVNMFEVAEIKDNIFLMKNGSLVQISRRKKNDIKEVFSTFLFNQIRKEMSF